MENEFKNRKLENEKKSKRILLCLFLNIFFQLGIAYVNINNVMFMIEMMLSFIMVPEWQRMLYLDLGSVIMAFWPIVVTVMCNIKIVQLNKERQKIREEEIEYLCNKAFEENKHKFAEILEDGRNMSRSEQMAFLNRIKDNIVKAENNNKFKCKSADILMLNYLQDELEDILFPSVVEEERKEYTKVRKK